MKKHLLFLLFQLKASLRALPRILFSTVILALVVISVGFCGSKIMSTDAKKVNANIEIVIPPDDTTLLMAFQIYTNMDSISSIATCHLSESKEAAFDALEEAGLLPLLSFRQVLSVVSLTEPIFQPMYICPLMPELNPQFLRLLLMQGLNP